MLVIKVKLFLTGEQTEREVRGMQDVTAQVRSIIRSVGGLTPEEAEELDLKYEKAEARYENAQERIHELERESALLKSCIASLEEKNTKKEQSTD